MVVNDVSIYVEQGEIVGLLGLMVPKPYLYMATD